MAEHAAGLWSAARTPDDGRQHRGADVLVKIAENALEAELPSVALNLARIGSRSGIRQYQHDHKKAERIGKVQQIIGRASLDIGAVEIPVPETDPTYGIYKSNADFVQGNFVESPMPLGAATTGTFRVLSP